MTKQSAPSVAVVWRGERGSAFSTSGLPPIVDAFRSRQLNVVEAPFSEEAIADVRQQLFTVDAVLVWVDPISNGRNRATLDPLLREAADRGVWVSAHPDAILKMGTKDVLVKTREMEWGSDCYLYPSPEDMAAELPVHLSQGPRVLKQHRGNGGSGVWKVELVDLPAPSSTDPAVQVLHARRGSAFERMRLSEFVRVCSRYFEGTGCMIDQPFQSRLADGQIRCYIVEERVSGFGHQFVTALMPPVDGQAPPRNPRLYFGPSQPEFQAIKARLEGGWIQEMRRVLEMEAADLPVLWDADFFYGPKDASGADSYVLCEINVSSVDIFPDETLVALAEAVAARVMTA